MDKPATKEEWLKLVAEIATRNPDWIREVVNMDIEPTPLNVLITIEKIQRWQENVKEKLRPEIQKNYPIGSAIKDPLWISLSLFGSILNSTIDHANSVFLHSK